MDRRITRRDILHGAGALAAASLVPGRAVANEALAAEPGGGLGGAYPPALVGLRGNHIGAFEVAHELAREGRRDWGPAEEPDDVIYDLVVVGAGISGLAAAHFFRKSNPDARILILDNHDDFGGHAKRNEFSVDGRRLVGYGGSQTLEAPSGYSNIVKTLLDDLGIDVGRFEAAYDHNFYKRHGLAGGVFFNRHDWGADRLVRYDLSTLGSYLPLASSGLSPEQAVKQMPMSDRARDELLILLATEEDRLSDIPDDEKEDYLYSISYREFLTRHLDVSQPEVFAALQDLTADAGVGIEATSAGTALTYLYLPGSKAVGLPGYANDEPYIHHFPDGNASIARLLVREMIPAVAQGQTMEDVVTARFDYTKLDSADSPVRLRLSSTVVDAENDGDPQTAEQVRMSYVQNGQTYRVRAGRCILACYNSIIPSICPGLPASQREALALQVKAPILYSNVALRNWLPWKKLGIGAVVAPGSYHVNAMLDFPVSIGDYRFAANPDEPITVHMERFPHRPNAGHSVREQRRLGQHELLTTSFETIERNIRSQLADMLAGGGFDPARDIAAITVNRWAHGYAYFYNDLDDPYYEDWNDERYPHVQARKPFGRIAIANSDAGASATLDTAVEQAHRAVTELS